MTEPRKPLSLGKEILYSLVVVCTLVMAAEMGIRVWAQYFRTPYERFNSHKGRFELVPNTRYTRPDGREVLINAKGFVGRDFEEAPPEGVFRIISIGDSCTFTLGMWRFAYPSILEGLLNTGNGNRRFEVINAGIEGYNSTYALARLRDEIIRYSPDLVTIYIGWNDLMKTNPSNPTVAGKHSWLAELMQASYLVKAYRKLVYVYLRPYLFRPGESSAKDLRIYDNFVPVTYERNLRSMIHILQEKDVEVMLFTLPTVVRPGMTPDELKEHSVFFPYFAGTYSVNKFLSLHRAYNRAIRSVARKHHIPVIDLDEEFRRHGKDELFWDTMHPNARGNQLIAEIAAKRIRELGL